jgi:hypothetical protein
MEKEAFGAKINNTIQKNLMKGEAESKALLKKGNQSSLDCFNASQDGYAFMSNQTDASTQEDTAQQ